MAKQLVLISVMMLNYIFAVFMLSCGVMAEVKIEAMQHDVREIDAVGFPSNIGKFRQDGVSALYFFNRSDDSSFLETFNEVAKNLKNMVTMCGIDCSKGPNKKFCEDNNVNATPAVMLYPPNPMPAFLQDSAKLTREALQGQLGKLIPFRGKFLTADNIDLFLTADPTIPKVILFTKKKAPAVIYKALTTDKVYIRSISFGFVNTETQTDLVTKYLTKDQIKKDKPVIIMRRGVSKSETKLTYNGDISSYQQIYDWINPFSESGMGDQTASVEGGGKVQSLEDAKPWLMQEIPEFYGASHQDVCMKPEGLCVIYVQKGATLSKTDESMLASLKDSYTSQLSDRGTILKWMWLDIEQEEEYEKLFGIDEYPSAVVLNPHKRLRYTQLEEGVKANNDTIRGLMDKILGGDGRFKVVKGQKMPPWNAREKVEKDQTKAKEEL